MTRLASATTSVHVNRDVGQVLDYLEVTLGPRLGLVGDLTIDREASTAQGMAVPGSQVQRGQGGTSIVHLGAGRAVGWIVQFDLADVGGGTNVSVDVTQFNDSFLQRKMARGQLQSYVDQIAVALHADLGA